MPQGWAGFLNVCEGHCNLLNGLQRRLDEVKIYSCGYPAIGVRSFVLIFESCGA